VALMCGGCNHRFGSCLDGIAPREQFKITGFPLYCQFMDD